MAQGFNQFMMVPADANSATAQHTEGQMAYSVDTTSGAVHWHRYYKAVDAVAIANGTVLHAADIGLAQGSADRNGTNTLSTLFLGIAQASMTQNYYGWALRKGVKSGVVCASGASHAAGTLLCASTAATGADGECTDGASQLDSSSAANLESTSLAFMRAHLGITKVAATGGSCTAIVCPMMELPIIG